MTGSSETIRVASVQWQAGTLSHPDALYDRIGYFVDAAADYRSDFVVFPELFTLDLVEPAEGAGPQEVVRQTNAHTKRLIDTFAGLAHDRNINIIGGSHLHLDDDGIVRNTSTVFLRDGTVHSCVKLHPTPNERTALEVIGGNSASVVETDRGPIGVMICYDSEFPEVARHLIDQGARVLFVPYCTDTSHGHLRVRYCCHARTVENQCYVVTSGMTGRFATLPDPFGCFAQSTILTPSDLPFARDGIAAEATANAEMIIFADLDLTVLEKARQTGTVRNLDDRRPDLYAVDWKG